MQLIDLVLTAAKVTTLDEVVDLLPPPTSRGVQLEGPQEVGGILEVGSNGQNLVDEILHTDDAELAQGALNQIIGGDGGAVAVDLYKSTLVHQLAHRLEVRSSPGDVRLTDPEHVDGSLVQLDEHPVVYLPQPGSPAVQVEADEHPVVYLPQPEQLENLLHLGGHLVYTTDAHDKGKLGISGNIIVSLLASLTAQPDLIPLLILVLLGELLSTLEDVSTLGFASNLGLDSLLSPEGAVLCLPLPSLQDRLRHCRQFAFHSHCGFSCRSESSNKSL